VLWFSLYTALILALLYGLLCAFYWAFQERFVFVRFRVPRNYRFKFPGPFEEVFLRTEDGAELHALHFKVERPKGIVLYFHGNTGSLRRWGKRAPRFQQLGHDVLMMDHRGYGKSRGRLSEAALHADALLWYQYLRKTWPEDRIVLYGRSLGSGMAVPLAASTKPRMLILESPFANLFDAVGNAFSFLPYRWLLRYRFRNDKAIQRVKCPVYIFHGKRDPVVPLSSALKLYAAIPSGTPREMTTFNKGYHNDLAQFARFRRKLHDILLGTARTPR
jgi:uncharacterized protein